jgi:flagellar hook assembly protein FlgD
MVYPNPFEDELNFEFTLYESQNVTIDLFDVTGKLVAKILNNTLERGKHKITWQTNEAKNGQLNSGIYVSIIKTADATHTKKVILSKHK